MLNEPILGLLPATEEGIVEAWPKVNPDHVIGRLRRLERAGAIRKRKNGKFYTVKRPEDEPLHGKHARRNPVNESQLKKRTCTVCGVTHVGIHEHFGFRNAKVCKHCKAKGYSPVEALKQSKVCVMCGEEKFGLKRNFRQTSIPGSNGRVKVWRDTCKACEGRYVTRALA